MKKEVHISIYLDTRKAKQNGKFPVKLRVFTPTPRKQKMYSTKFEFTVKEFDKTWLTVKPRDENKADRKNMQDLLNKAEDVAKQMTPFMFEQFEAKLYRRKGDGIKLDFHYNEKIFELTKEGRIGTASSYELSRKSIIDFITVKKKSTKFSSLTFYDIDVKWLKDYETYMTQEKERSITTVGIYLRNVRALFNHAIATKEIEKERYPFGVITTMYSIPSATNKKKSLNKAQLKVLFNSEPQTPQQQKAKDFWFFSYACNGINIKDIAMLKNRDIKDGKFEFVRQKTKLTTQRKQTKITVYLNEFSSSIIEKYGVTSESPESFVFDIIKDRNNFVEVQKNVQNFTRFVNQHLKQLCKANNLPEDTSTYSARHSYANNAMNNGASMEFIQESLGHQDMKTTMSYLSGFEDETKKEFAQKLMEF